MQTIQVGGMRVACLLEGDPSASVVALAHGLMTSHRVWDVVAERLAPRWRVLRYDLRGHGDTEVTAGPYTIPQLADDVVHLFDALRLDRVHFIGASLGGMVGQQLAARHGDRLLTLTLANTTAVMNARAAWAERIEAAMALGVAPQVEPTLRRWFTEAAFVEQAALIDKMRRIANATPVDGFIAAASAIRDLDQADILPRIMTPTLIVAGGEDQATPMAQAEALAAGITGAQLAVLPAAHQAAAEQPAEFVRLFEGFAARRPLGG